MKLQLMKQQVIAFFFLFKLFIADFSTELKVNETLKLANKSNNNNF